MNVMAYVIEGEGYFGQELKRAEAHHSVVFNNNSEKIQIKTEDKSVRFLLLAGAPINEPIARHGRSFFSFYLFLFILFIQL